MAKMVESSDIGYVAFCDVLGYQSIMENNEIEKVTVILRDFLLKLPEDTQKSMLEKVNEDYREEIAGILHRIGTMVVSDSILVNLHTTTLKSPQWLVVTVFLGYVSQLLYSAYVAGLPLRGAVSYGDFFVMADERCFAGYPIIEAYRLGKRLQFSGCALTSKASEQVLEAADAEPGLREWYNKCAFPYVCPLKGGVDARLLLLNWYARFESDEERDNIKRRDLRQEIVEKFHAHSKDVRSDVFEKADNTERIIRFSIGCKWDYGKGLKDRLSKDAETVR